uniref:Uncharacterized protein n=1 Tax=Caenorhabditis tropicalis TaxID=1561998 RepID=A0A1I7TF02_9PELO
MRPDVARVCPCFHETAVRHALWRRRSLSTPSHVLCASFFSFLPVTLLAPSSISLYVCVSWISILSPPFLEMKGTTRLLGFAVIVSFIEMSQICLLEFFF